MEYKRQQFGILKSRILEPRNYVVDRPVQICEWRCTQAKLNSEISGVQQCFDDCLCRARLCQWQSGHTCLGALGRKCGRSTSDEYGRWTRLWCVLLERTRQRRGQGSGFHCFLRRWVDSNRSQEWSKKNKLGPPCIYNFFPSQEIVSCRYRRCEPWGFPRMQSGAISGNISFSELVQRSWRLFKATWG